MTEKKKASDYLAFLSGSFAKMAKNHRTNFTIGDLIFRNQNLQLKVICGEGGLSKKLTSLKIQKPGLALAGYLDYLETGRVQVLGRAEIRFMEGRVPDELEGILLPIFESGVTCFCVTRALPVPQALHRLSQRYDVPLLTSPLCGNDLVDGILLALERELAMAMTFHGTLLSVFGMGVLLIGKSGVGKSECAIDLIMRGHQLVTDDMVQVRRNVGGQLIGTGDPFIQHHMEIRGLGIISVPIMFGISSVMDSQSIDLVAYLELWEPKKHYESLELEQECIDLLGIPRPVIRLPVSPGRNLANLIEIAVRAFLMKEKGFDPAKDLTEKLRIRLEEGH